MPGVLDLQNTLEGGVGADAVIVAVAADEAAVQTDLGGHGGRDHLQLGGVEVVLGDAVLGVETLHDLELHPLGVLLIPHRAAAQEDVQGFAGDGLAQGLLALLSAQVGQQVGDDELGLVALAQHHRDDGAVLQSQDAVHLQRDGDPLVLADTAVVVGLEVGHLSLLIEGVGLQVQAGGVDVAGHDVAALGEALLTDDGQHHALAPVAGVDLVACVEGHAPLELHETGLLGQLHGLGGALPLDFAVVQEVAVGLAVGLHQGQFCLGNSVIAVFLGGKQLLLAVFDGFTHAFVSSSIHFVKKARAVASKASGLSAVLLRTSVQCSR